MQGDDFEIVIDRRKTNSAKYDGYQDIYGANNLIPLWVADMDFCTPEFVFDAIENRMKHHSLGYFTHSDGFYQAIIGWMHRRHQWKVKKEWIYFSTGVMPSIFYLVQAFSAPGDKILVPTPAYSPFFSVVKNQKRELVITPLRLAGDHYEIDFDHLECCLKLGIKIMIMCNPHNPTGRCWSDEELKAVRNLCLKYNCLIVSDEIHSDLIMPGYKHTPMANISEEISMNTITCMSPSKTFNLAGLSTSEIIIPDPTLRIQFEKFKQGLHLFVGNIFGEIALEACYNQGDEWLSKLLHYLKENVDYMQHYFQSFIPEIRTFRHEATYLPWLDFSAFGLPHGDLSRLLVEKAKVALSDGSAFGKEGEMHFRINVACQRATLEKALNQLKLIFSS